MSRDVSPISDELVAELARAAIEVSAPDEVMFFDMTAEAYWEDPDAMLKVPGGKGDALGFGLTEGVVLMTPVALAVATDVVKYLINEVKKRALAEGADAVVSWIRALFVRKETVEPIDEARALTSAQVANVRRIAIEKSVSLDLPMDKAELLADAIVGNLAHSAA